MGVEKLQLPQKGNNTDLVFLGRRQEGSDNACLAYIDTVSWKPKESIALLFFNIYYKNYQESHKRLLWNCEKILKLVIRNETALGIIKIVAKIGFDFKNLQAIQILLEYLNKEPTVKVYVVAKFQLFQILKEDIILCNAYDSSLENYLAQKEFEGPLYDSFCIALSKMILRKCCDLDSALEVITHWPFFAPNAMFRHWLCKYICTNFLLRLKFTFDIMKYKSDITQGIEHLGYPNLLNVMLVYALSPCKEFIPDFKSLPKPEEISRRAADFIMVCLYLDRKWKYLENYTSIFIHETGYECYRNQTHLFLFTSYAEQKKWQQAINIAPKIDHDFLSSKNISVLAKCFIESGQSADHLMKYLEGTEYHKEIQALILSKEFKFNEIVQLIDKDTDIAMECFHLGMAYFELRDYGLSLEYFDKAIEIDSTCSDIYYHYGIFCQNRGAYTLSKYYLDRAFQYNSSDLNIIQALVEFYAARRGYTDIIILLKRVSEYLDDVPWIYVTIAVQYLKLNQKENCILYLREAIKCDERYFDAYLHLALVNYKLGYYEKSIDCYYQLIELDRRFEVQYLTRIGNIRLELNQFEEAIAIFQRALEVNPNYSQAIRDLLQTWLKLASSQENDKDYFNARETAQMVLDYAVEIICNGNPSSHYWRMVGEALMVIAKLPDEYRNVDIMFFNDEILGDLGTIYEKSTMELLIEYTAYRERNIVVTEDVIKFGNRILVDICEEENASESDYLKFYSPVDLEMTYKEWVSTFARRQKESSTSNL